jgi:hypothetical protein
MRLTSSDLRRLERELATIVDEERKAGALNAGFIGG